MPSSSQPPKRPRHAKVTTRTGDAGYTGVMGGERLPKHDPLIEALGAVDEANSVLGLARASATDDQTRAIILQSQRDLYILMAELAGTEKEKLSRTIDDGAVARLEELSEALKVKVEIPGVFVVPGDSPSGAALDLARTVVRRAERAVARLAHEGRLGNPEILRYLNRLSDLAFILARYEERNLPGHTLSGPLLS